MLPWIPELLEKNLPGKAWMRTLYYKLFKAETTIHIASQLKNLFDSVN